ncbi:MAG: TIGR00282 family metallophosphoesterase [Syntrophaceae bacterium]
MNILFIGDIMGKPGRRAVRELLPGLLESREIDLVIANCENAAGGFGVTRDIVEELFSDNIDVLTSGNHIWDKKEIESFIEDYRNLIRPANYPKGVRGFGSTITVGKSGTLVGVLNLMGRVFMRDIDCPFRAAQREIALLKERTKIVIVDFHAEATSEKQALGWFLDGEASAVLGTHTHVQTADERVLSKGTGFITDAGMTGPFDSIIGNEKSRVIERFLTGVPNKFEVARGDVFLQGVLLNIDPVTGLCAAIERINLKLDRNHS